MRATGAGIKWYEGYANYPTLRIDIPKDDIPNFDNFSFKQHENLYFARCGDAVKFFAYSAPGEGYGGSVFDIQMEDGSHKKLIGPWSSRSSVMNMHFDQCVEVTVNDYLGMAVTLEFAERVLKEHLPDFKFEKVTDRENEIYYELRYQDGSKLK